MPERSHSPRNSHPEEAHAFADPKDLVSISLWVAQRFSAAKKHLLSQPPRMGGTNSGEATLPRDCHPEEAQLSPMRGQSPEHLALGGAALQRCE